MVEMAPRKKARRSVPVSVRTRRRSESNRRRGIARGTRERFIMSYIGEENGMIPTLATINARAMVANGAERALPRVVRRSNVIPNVERSNTADKTNTGSVCSNPQALCSIAGPNVVVVGVTAVVTMAGANGSAVI